MKKTITYLITVLLFASTLIVDAQDQQPAAVDLYDLSLEELMTLKVDVSKTDLSIRETPSVISVITQKEIENLGARDLMDILNQIPGFYFGVDVQNIIGAGIGKLGHEGKLLLLIDGVEMNETLFSRHNSDNTDIKNIDRIEIIRGPGSSIYGGYAELGMVNIITRSETKTRNYAQTDRSRR
jgi:outer membrane receptor for ferrienterochelin and colicin